MPDLQPLTEALTKLKAQFRQEEEPMRVSEITKEYKGHTITITDESMRFRVTGPLVDDWFHSFSEAKIKIDDVTSKHEVQTRKRIAIDVLTSQGAVATVTGIHAGNGSILGVPKNRGYGGDEFYPKVPWILEALKRLAALKEEQQLLDEQLGPFRMSAFNLRRRSGEDHADLVDRLVQTIESLTRQAEAMAPKDAA